VTLRFLGAPESEQKEALEHALDSFRHPGFLLNLRGIGHFPLKGDPKVLWVGLEPCLELTSLAKKMENLSRRAGFSPESRNYHPHITLARLGDAPPSKVFAYEDEFGLYRKYSVPIRSLGLFHSRLGVEGSRYDLLDEWDLDPFEEDTE
jgi:2'-5' RNA ligase